MSHLSADKAQKVLQEVITIRSIKSSMIFSIFCQGSYGGYVYTYAVKSSLHMTSAQGAFLTSVFWVSN